MTRAVIGGIGAAYPAVVDQGELWDRFFATHYGGVQRALANRIFKNSGVRSRHAAVNPIVEDVTRWSTARRMQRYLVEALPLGKAAVTDALSAAGVAAADLGMFVVCSCTGYVTPGLDILLARDLGLPPDAGRLFVGHMGCYAALPGLSAVSDYVRTHDRPAALLCTELTSLHLQPPSAEADQIVSHALFADAAAAAVVVPARDGYEVLDVASVTDATSADHMTWDVTDLGFRMSLSPQVPEVLKLHVADLVDKVLSRHGLSREDIDGWAVHPGGPRILEVIETELALPPPALAESRGVLAEHGNCSSPTVLMVLDAITRRPAPPGSVLMLAFGPGLTLYTALLSRRSRTASPGTS
ncbi:MAG TPA: 3-oxoacyl-[acyl-carrier-protein] synthase III C-terminal domain-containing protein [Micromonosporaceae bacterium]|nr:3-oxoacyl-[acyl-carrier-protein] synthase III C-terminal domain-containing protein [Micromonosporaceae bacterium]